MAIFKKPFNAVIEYSNEGPWWQLNIAKARIDFPKESNMLNDSANKYILYGKTSAGTIQEIKASSGIEAKIEPLSKNARAIVMMDGKIFLNEHIEKEEDYLNHCLRAALYHAKNIFEENRFTKLRHKYYMSKVLGDGFLYN
jgi:hypothetical protein